MADSSRSKSVLGKGLSALIPRTNVSEEAVAAVSLPQGTGDDNVIVAIEVSKIRPNPFQPRTDFDAQTLDELKRSIVEKGVIQPITVRRTLDRNYELISGERRVRASQEAGLKTIPAYIIRVESDAEMLELALIENLQREHLNPIEVAQSYKRLIEECRLTQEEVAQKIGKDRSTVTNFLRLLKLPEKIQHALRKDEITMGHARALITLPDEKTQMRVFAKIVKNGLSVRKVEEAVKVFGEAQKKKKVVSFSSPRVESGIQSIESRLRHALGTKVSIRHKSSGAGEIVIEYYNADDLERLRELLER
ncbi:MAG: ParB/RepB/Spo0J family partition protein [Bacteroidota bacterium]|nr:ParB/RepB/Spo0J family partition protein [Bacteroidota bacterium]